MKYEIRFVVSDEVVKTVECSYDELRAMLLCGQYAVALPTEEKKTKKKNAD